MAELSRATQLPGVFTIQVHTKTVGNGTALKLPAWINNTGAKVELTEATFVPDADVTGAATNNFALEYINAGTAGSGTTAMVTKITFASGTDMTALVEKVFTISTTKADLAVDKNEVVALDKTENGSGLTLPAGVATLVFRFIH